MKTQLLVALLVLIICAEAFSDKPCAVIHPTPRATNNEELTAFFLNGIYFQCPAGMKVVDPKHLMHSGMTYEEVFNASAEAECRP